MPAAHLAPGAHSKAGGVLISSSVALVGILASSSSGYEAGAVARLPRPSLPRDMRQTSAIAEAPRRVSPQAGSIDENWRAASFEAVAASLLAGRGLRSRQPVHVCSCICQSVARACLVT